MKELLKLGSLNPPPQKKKKAEWIIRPYLGYYLSEFLRICKIVHSDGQEHVQQSVWSQPC